jgi:CBS-domain-containing membrane protein
VAHAFTVLVLKRSILTEKVARRGFHVSREYAIDALEILFAREVMQADVVVIRADASLDEATSVLSSTPVAEDECLFPTLDATGRLVGVVTRRDLETAARDRAFSGGDGAPGRALSDLLRKNAVTVRADEAFALLRRRSTGACLAAPRGARESLSAPGHCFFVTFRRVASLIGRCRS